MYVFLDLLTLNPAIIATVTNVGGGLADMWDQRQRATAVVFYSLAVVAGPNIGVSYLLLERT